MEDEVKQVTYFTEEGEAIDPENVYFRQDGIPYLLFIDENGERHMTRIPLIEAEVSFTAIEDHDLSPLS